MQRILSPHNPRLKELRRLQTRRERERSGRFAAEGEDLIEAAQHAGWKPVEGYRSVDRSPPDRGLATHPELAFAPGFTEVEQTALAAVSTLGSGTRVIGVYEQRWSATPPGPLCVYLHGLSDPGNVGAVLRSAEAFGASSVALGPGCADPYSPKAIRASMGAIFAVALCRVGSLDELPGERIALVAQAGEPLQSIASAHPGMYPGTDVRPLTLLIGAERDGLPDELIGACDRIAHIPIASSSLNAAMAATIAMYEMTRVRAS